MHPSIFLLVAAATQSITGSFGSPSKDRISSYDAAVNKIPSQILRPVALEASWEEEGNFIQSNEYSDSELEDLRHSPSNEGAQGDIRSLNPTPHFGITYAQYGNTSYRYEGGLEGDSENGGEMKVKLRVRRADPFSSCNRLQSSLSSRVSSTSTSWFHALETSSKSFESRHSSLAKSYNTVIQSSYKSIANQVSSCLVQAGRSG